jgi:hypothetical protein
MSFDASSRALLAQATESRRLVFHYRPTILILSPFFPAKFYNDGTIYFWDVDIFYRKPGA